MVEAYINSEYAEDGSGTSAAQDDLVNKKLFGNVVGGLLGLKAATEQL